MDQLIRAICSFAVEDDGAQIVEYALIIAVVSVALTVALGNMSNGSFSTLIARVSNCLTTNACV
jgi:pilus assembly protein Flp/PilA